MGKLGQKFDKVIDVEGLREDLQEVVKNNQSFEEVPHDTYEVKIEKLELGESKVGNVKLVCWMRILNGKFKNSIIFMNQSLTNNYSLHIANEFVKSLDAKVVEELIEENNQKDIQKGIDPRDSIFYSYTQYEDLLMDIHEEIDGELEYLLKYDQNKKGYDTFEIQEVYEA